MKPKPRVRAPFFRLSPNRGFTLVELLVVIVIIGVLASVVLAMLGPMRANARTARCVSTLRSVVGAFDQFAADYGGYYPAVTYDSRAQDGRVNPNKSHWWVELKPYLSELDVKPRSGAEGNPFAICPSGYTGMNSWFYGYQFPRVAIVRPSRTILLGDSYDHALTVWIGDPTGEKFKHSEPQRHRGSANYAFADGHVETLKLEDAYRLYNRDPLN